MMPGIKIACTYCLFLLLGFAVKADDGHALWLRKRPANPVNVVSAKQSPILEIARKELQDGWLGSAGATFVLTIKKDRSIRGDGYRFDGSGVQANTELGILYGVYEVLRRQQTGLPVMPTVSNPSYDRRILNHWDNLNGSVERGYAGLSIFWRDEKDAPAVTEKDRSLWLEYARANASLGVNGTVINNVNASPRVLTRPYLEKVKAVADIMRRYGIRTYLSVNFSSPAQLGGLKNSDPLVPEVAQWWKDKTKEIYALIPDFGGFLVKANSEGQPGPQDFGRTHADGANMLADVLKPYGGIVMWRAFVYAPNDNDRAGQAYTEFVPLDGQFRDNVIIQVKNGPIDFQPREPFSALFGAMKKTSVMPELQITQEYLGHSNHLAFLAPMWEECLQSDTYQQGAGSTVARCSDGSIYPQRYTAIAGVANTGLDTNWCGHTFAQANWYAFGRLAWNNQLGSEKIAEEWLQLTFGPEDAAGPAPAKEEWQQQFFLPVKQMMLESREAVVNYMMPLGLHHIFSVFEHYGPGPWYGPKGVRPDWTPPYYHQADTNGIGFNRTATGSNTLSQYKEPLHTQLANPATCPEELLLWFHHLPWDYRVKSGRSLWDELCYSYQKGLLQVRGFQQTWDKVEPYADAARFRKVQSKLRRQCLDAQIWKDACLLYFQQFSRRPIPFDIERPVYDLDYLMKLNPLTLQVFERNARQHH
ncbi:alpha-glucuronidase [Chitinophaga sp. XS-30]|uniref:alpha-glucuronidase n=1 Tax=Chitinophaga sp. XS-30 TaxID=2604421 RepID=UPI001AEF747C|nr:alpha-glucuronidase [Chitinophaga sp. XS-30]